MQFTTLLALSATALASIVKGAVMPQARADQPTITTFHANSCTDFSTGNYQDFAIYDDEPSVSEKVGECFGPDEYNWTAVNVQQGATTYSVELYSGQACTGLLFTINDNQCVQAPEGATLESAIYRTIT